jgi:hypothetical protein
MANPPLHRLSVKGDIMTFPLRSIFLSYVIDSSQKIGVLAPPWMKTAGSVLFWPVKNQF